MECSELYFKHTRSSTLKHIICDCFKIEDDIKANILGPNK